MPQGVRVQVPPSARSLTAGPRRNPASCVSRGRVDNGVPRTDHTSKTPVRPEHLFGSGRTIGHDIRSVTAARFDDDRRRPGRVGADLHRGLVDRSHHRHQPRRSSPPGLEGEAASRLRVAASGRSRRGHRRPSTRDARNPPRRCRGRRVGASAAEGPEVRRASVHPAVERPSATSESEDLVLGQTYLYIGDGWLLTVQRGEGGKLTDLPAAARRRAREHAGRGDAGGVHDHGRRRRRLREGGRRRRDRISKSSRSRSSTRPRTRTTAASTRCGRTSGGSTERSRASRRRCGRAPATSMTLTVGTEQIVPYLHDLLDDAAGTAALINNQSRALDAVLSSHENNVAARQNKDMRTISSFAALLALPTLIAGLYGMNFKNIPLVQWQYGWMVDRRCDRRRRCGHLHHVQAAPMAVTATFPISFRMTGTPVSPPARRIRGRRSRRPGRAGPRSVRRSRHGGHARRWRRPSRAPAPTRRWGSGSARSR